MFLFKSIVFFVLIVIPVVWPVPLILAQTKPILVVATASNMQAPMAEIQQAFQQKTNIAVSVVVGSSRLLYTQIIQGAPFDVFVSADQEAPKKLIAAGYSTVQNYFDYAQGRLVLLVQQDLLTKEGMQKKGVYGVFPQYPVIERQKLRKLLNNKNYLLAAANPDLAPYGKATQEVLEFLAMRNDFLTKVQMNNIAQVWHLYHTKNVHLAITALSQLKNAAVETQVWLIPQQWHQPIVQGLVLLNTGAKKTFAQEFFQYMQGQSVKKILQGYGYSIPKK